MTTTRLVLCRHGEPEDGARGLVYGSLDVGLSPAGEEHARQLAQALAEVPLEAVYTSPRRRARKTAVAVAHHHACEPVELSDLCELDFGDLEGLSYDEAAVRWPDVYAAWMERPTSVAFPGGESYADLRARVLRAVEHLRASHRGGAAAVVAHGGVIRAVLALALEMPDSAIFRIDQRYGAINVVDWLDGTPLVRALNCAPDRWPLG